MRFLFLPRLICLLLLALFAAGCARGAEPGLFPVAAGGDHVDVYLIRHRWHTGLVLPRGRIPAGLIEAAADLPPSPWVAIGWGDAVGYRNDLTVGVIAEALFWPTHSIMRIEPIADPVIATYGPPDYATDRVRLSPEGFRRLCAAIDASFARGPDGRPVRLDEGWYDATGKYDLLSNCNQWTARALVAAGCPMSPRWAISSSLFRCQSRRFVLPYEDETKTQDKTKEHEQTPTDTGRHEPR